MLKPLCGRWGGIRADNKKDGLTGRAEVVSLISTASCKGIGAEEMLFGLIGVFASETKK